MNLFNKLVLFTAFFVTLAFALQLRAVLPEPDDWENYMRVKAYVDEGTTTVFEDFCSRMANSEIKFDQEFGKGVGQVDLDLRPAAIFQAMITDVGETDSLSSDSKHHLVTFFGEIRADYLTVIESMKGSANFQEKGMGNDYKAVVTAYFTVLRDKIKKEEAIIIENSAPASLVQQTNQ